MFALEWGSENTMIFYVPSRSISSQYVLTYLFKMDIEDEATTKNKNYLEWNGRWGNNLLRKAKSQLESSIPPLLTQQDSLPSSFKKL